MIYLCSDECRLLHVCQIFCTLGALYSPTILFSGKTLNQHQLGFLKYLRISCKTCPTMDDIAQRFPPISSLHRRYHSYNLLSLSGLQVPAPPLPPSGNLASCRQILSQPPQCVLLRVTKHRDCNIPLCIHTYQFFWHVVLRRCNSSLAAQTLENINFLSGVTLLQGAWDESGLECP